jgi:hypothetical protein
MLTGCAKLDRVQHVLAAVSARNERTRVVMVSTQVSPQTARSNLRDQLYLGEVSEVVLASLSAVLGSGDADAGAVSDCDGWGPSWSLRGCALRRLPRSVDI